MMKVACVICAEEMRINNSRKRAKLIFGMHIAAPVQSSINNLSHNPPLLMLTNR